MQNKLLFIVVAILVSCGNTQSTSKQKDTSAVVTPVKDAGLAKFDLLENIFQNDNWLLINGRDSSFLYCSRLGKAYVKTYHFSMFKGDSVNTVITSMHLSGDTITWRLPMDTITLQLKTATARELIWTGKTGLDIYIFEKTDSHHITIKYPGGSTKKLVKTPTLSSFLVRSKYDYLHRTKLAFSTEK
ncbi:MAG TPA: hypothetical protein VK645_18840 [Chitinophagaceae bacterium]|nr:hypothetical protein [Chitinophagaceae bacterium]